VTIPVADIPVTTSLDWEDASIEEPRGGEELATIVPIGRMSLADCCVQASRQGALKKMPRAAFESYVAKNFVGSGIKRNTDRTCGLVLCAKDDRVVLASQLGYLLTADVSTLAYSIEETIRLSHDDHIVSAFSLGSKKQVILLTHNGKALTREVSWLTPAGVSLRTRGQSVFSEERRKSGASLVGATAAGEQDWVITLDSLGSISIFPVRQLFGMGAVFSTPRDGLQLVSFTVLSEQAG
jgi:DNA gyrase/topoisomerase IV subunit A